MTGTATIEVLRDATMGIREEYIARYTEIELAQLYWLRKGLAEVGMDANKFAPYPHGSMDRNRYRAAVDKHHAVHKYFQTTWSRSMYEPCIVAERPEAEAELRASALRAANAIVNGYLEKMAAKIGKDISAAVTNGRIWDSATLTVTCDDGEIQVWNTRCILNRSVLGRLFNQWPTRRKK